MDPIYRDDDEAPTAGWTAVPGQRSADGAAPAFTLEVDGQVFALRPDARGGMGYDWLTGPNAGYGFGLSPAAGLTTEQHVGHIRDFLAEVDPATGYLADADGD
ncbi:hypothetical protein [Nocardioides massiliensis]|uniref:Uncharacterized protein n=1 Tax=Nocardioides massiliensis TaxID=1325935 RepID=A0ABT9NMD3_9ACTN|nr:hypothetical protein [Nocardioides massiliensis]MDP9821369.1 hypothetical protein [Nocardioides massiliensis]